MPRCVQSDSWLSSRMHGTVATVPQATFGFKVKVRSIAIDKANLSPFPTVVNQNERLRLQLHPWGSDEKNALAYKLCPKCGSPIKNGKFQPYNIYYQMLCFQRKCLSTAVMLFETIKGWGGVERMGQLRYSEVEGTKLSRKFNFHSPALLRCPRRAFPVLVKTKSNASRTPVQTKRGAWGKL